MEDRRVTSCVVSPFWIAKLIHLKTTSVDTENMTLL